MKYLPSIARWILGDEDETRQAAGFWGVVQQWKKSALPWFLWQTNQLYACL
jgi:hypothetical protein